MTEAPALLEVSDLRKHYPVRSGILRRAVGTVYAVDGVSFKLGSGETLGLVGESGCGKSTVARSILRLVEPTAGRVIFDDVELTGLAAEPLRRRRRDLQMVFQDPTASLNPRLSVRRTVEEPLRRHTALAAGQRRARVAEVLGQVGLGSELAGRFPREPSGGQRPPANIPRARAPVAPPPGAGRPDAA